MTFDVVIPTVRRVSLEPLRARLADLGVRPDQIRVVDDARERSGPASARNRGWRASAADWIVFLDDDVLPEPGWLDDLNRDLSEASPDVAGIQGRIAVPLPADRGPTDAERTVKGLETARWPTADMALRRSALIAVGGFDQRFPRAFREDSDLAFRLMDAGWRLERGRRFVLHPVRPAGVWDSVRRERGNADDALMLLLHGRGWHRRAGARVGRRAVHLAITAAGAAAVASAALGHRRAAFPLGGAWLIGMMELAWHRVQPGPRSGREIATVLLTSPLLPPSASFHWLRGLVRACRLVRTGRPEAVLLDRDGTLVVDVPFNGDPERVEPTRGAREALARLRAAGIPTAVVSNQSGIGRGLLTREAVASVNRRIEELLGPLGPWFVCPHAPGEGCDCRKPLPGLVCRAARTIGVRPERCAVVGDVGTDMEAAAAAGARGILVPTERTRPEEVAAAREVAPDLQAAVDLLLAAAK
jgi:histidinol-phosphate phosphatase family protein